MNLKSKLFFIALFLLLVSCKNTQLSKNYLITLKEFKALSKRGNVKIIDFRKNQDYNNGHVENAINIWRKDIENDKFTYDGMMASKIQLELLFSRLGIHNDDTLVVYDDKGLCDAARFWWVLQYYNFTNVKLLDGGFESIKRGHFSLTKTQPSITPSTFTFSPEINNKILASKKQIETAINNGNVIIDTRTEDEYLGSILKKGAFLKGNIPTSKFIDWANAINYSGDKKTKSIVELEKIYNTLDIKKTDTIYVYCHSGVRSAHTTFVLTQLLGYENVLNYDGSWIEWSYYKKKINESKNSN